MPSPTTHRMRRIVNLLTEGSYGFNEMCHKLGRYTSRQTLKKDLDNLLKMQLIAVKKGRRGQKNVYMCKEVLVKFEEQTRHLKTEWAKLFRQLRDLSKLLETGELEDGEAGRLIASLLFRAVAIGSSGSRRPFTLEAKLRLVTFNEEKFHDFTNKVITFGKQHPEIRGGFEKEAARSQKLLEDLENALWTWAKEF